jgi:hypothetical protein
LLSLVILATSTPHVLFLASTFASDTFWRDRNVITAINCYVLASEKLHALSQAFTRSSTASWSSVMAPATGVTGYVINHVVLPLNLPQTNDYDIEHERSLLENTIHTLQDLRTYAIQGKGPSYPPSPR